jgi:hypothetical protein
MPSTSFAFSSRAPGLGTGRFWPRRHVLTDAPAMVGSADAEECYHLPRQVYACRTEGGGIVFLDAGRNRYFGLGGGGSVARLSDLIEGLADRESAQTPRSSSDQQQVTAAAVEGLAGRLIEAGLLGRGADEDVSKKDMPRVPPPDIAASMAIDDSNASAGVMDAMRFACACVVAGWALWRLSLEEIASRVRATRRATEEFDFTAVAALVRRFQILRSLAFSGKNRCLFNALALIYFLQWYGYFPYFVIGVKIAPFAAHSWVQKDGVILDGDAATVGHFIPILVA